jgi:hypothetical protein
MKKVNHAFITRLLKEYNITSKSNNLNVGRAELMELYGAMLLQKELSSIQNEVVEIKNTHYFKISIKHIKLLSKKQTKPEELGFLFMLSNYIEYGTNVLVFKDDLGKIKPMTTSLISKMLFIHRNKATELLNTLKLNRTVMLSDYGDYKKCLYMSPYFVWRSFKNTTLKEGFDDYSKALKLNDRNNILFVEIDLLQNFSGKDITDLGVLLYLLMYLKPKKNQVVHGVDCVRYVYNKHLKNFIDKRKYQQCIEKLKEKGVLKGSEILDVNPFLIRKLSKFKRNDNSFLTNY